MNTQIGFPGNLEFLEAFEYLYSDSMHVYFQKGQVKTETLFAILVVPFFPIRHFVGNDECGEAIRVGFWNIKDHLKLVRKFCPKSHLSTNSDSGCCCPSFFYTFNKGKKIGKGVDCRVVI